MANGVRMRLTMLGVAVVIAVTLAVLGGDETTASVLV